MATKTKVNKMNEEDEKKMTQWFQESKDGRLLSDEKMAERYPVVFSMLSDNQEAPPTMGQPQKTETIAATDSSAATPSSTVTETTSMEPMQENCGMLATVEEPAAEVAVESESPDAPMTEAEPVSLPDGKDDKQPLIHRVSSKQRRLSFEEYRSVYLPVPKIENPKPVFISASLRDELDKIARRLGGKRMSASGLVENMVKQHMTAYGDELKEWYKL